MESTLVWTTTTGEDARRVEGNVTTMLVAELSLDFGGDIVRVAAGEF